MPEFTETSKELGIQNVHLVSGEDIIGDVTETFDPNTQLEPVLIVKKPVTPNVMGGPGPDGKPTFRVGLLPLRAYLSDVPVLVIPNSRVIYSVEVPDKMRALYMEFTTGLTLAHGIPQAGPLPGSTPLIVR